jgi:hypothetical protein
VAGDVVQDHVLGLHEADGRPADLLGKTGLLVHRPYDLRHPRQGGLLGVDNHVDAIPQHLKIGVGDQRGHLEQRVLAQIEAGHFAVDPDKKITHGHSLRSNRTPRLGATDTGRPVPGGANMT